MAIEYFEIRVYNRAGTKKAFISSTADGHPVLGGSFTLKRNHGCADCTLTIARRQFFGDISQGYLLEIWAKPQGGTLTRYYMGTVVGTPVAGTTAETVEYEATGLWYQVERQSIIKFYEGAAIDTIIEAILDDIDNDSDISDLTSEIDITSAYTLGDFEAEYMSAADGIKLLAQVQGDVQYGVDQDGKLYFKDLSTTEVAAFWVGKHIHLFEPREYSDGAINRLIMQSRKMIGGGFLSLTRDQTTGDHSIANIGLRDKVMQIPHLSDPDDVWRWGEKVLADSGIKTICEARPAGFTDFIFPRGDVRIVDEDGTEYDLPIQAVRYTIDPARGFIGDMEIGDEVIPDVAEQVRRIQRDVAANKSNAIGLTKIEHTRGEEFRQESIVYAEKLGIKNNFIESFTDTKTLNIDTSSSVVIDSDRNYLSGPIADDDVWNSGRAYTKVIPAGQQPSAVRMHLDYDILGRISFNYDEDFTEFWTDADGWWRNTSDEPSLEQYQDPSGTGYLFYKQPDNFTWPQYMRVMFRLKDLIDSSVYDNTWWTYFVWNYVDENNYSYFRWRINESASFGLRVELGSLAAGSRTTHDSDVASEFSAYHIDITAEPVAPAGTTTVRIREDNINESVDTTLTSTAVPNSTGKDFGFNGFWWTGGVGKVTQRLGYFEIYDLNQGEAPQANFSISQDGGTTWATPYEPNKTLHVDRRAIVPGGTGSDLVMRAFIRWPARLYGWGVSFKN